MTALALFLGFTNLHNTYGQSTCLSEDPNLVSYLPFDADQGATVIDESGMAMRSANQPDPTLIEWETASNGQKWNMRLRRQVENRSEWRRMHFILDTSQVWGKEELNMTMQVRPDGKITFSLVNDFMVAGLLTHNTLRGAARGAILVGELIHARGLAS